MFTVYLTNFGYALGDSFSTLEAAKERGRRTGFEFAVLKDGNAVGYWTQFGGWCDA